MTINGYLRNDGRKGIRNNIVVTYLVECAHHVAREIVHPFRERGVNLIGFSGCYPNAYSHKMMERLCTHPNVGGALLVSLGCEGFNKGGLLETVRKSGRPARLVVIQDTGGTRKSIAEGQAWIEQTLAQLQSTPRAQMGLNELIVGTKCGGSDGLSGMIEDAKIMEVVKGATDLELAVSSLVEAANEAGGTDNITVLALQCAN